MAVQKKLTIRIEVDIVVDAENLECCAQGRNGYGGCKHLSGTGSVCNLFNARLRYTNLGSAAAPHYGWKRCKRCSLGVPV